MRVLDSFGTDAEFNYKHYKQKIPGGRSVWGDLDLHLPQFMTMYRKYELIVGITKEEFFMKVAPQYHHQR